MRDWRSKRLSLACALAPRTRRKAPPLASSSGRRSSRAGEAHDRSPSQRRHPQRRRRIQEILMASDNIFSGLKVVDLASFIAGPGAAVILSDFGADVIKVEPPTGDLQRIVFKVPPQPHAKD